MVELWIDLEGTVIPHWGQMDTFINMETLEGIIRLHKPTSMGIYSYAVWNQENLEVLRSSNLMKHLAGMMGNDNPIDIMTTYEMGRDWKALHRHNAVDPQDTGIWKQPKEFAFLMYVRRAMEAGSTTKTFILFDDTAPPHLVYTIEDVHVIFLNPDEM